MSKIHYFQRYSSVENTVTNNTLQLLGRIYEYSAPVASRLLTELTGETIEIGLEISQQFQTGRTIPDGAIIQRSFKILLEAKVGAAVDARQLIGHTEGFGDEKQKVLLLLTRQPVGPVVEADLACSIGEKCPDVVFKNITYETICAAIADLFLPHEAAMVALTTDYIEYCNETGLFDQTRFLMRVVPCGRSVEINKHYGIYFDPTDRGYTPHAFVGIYHNKRVEAVIQVECIIDATLSAGVLTKKFVKGEPTDRYDDRLRGIIADAQTVCGYDITANTRFFCGPLAPTDFRKTSPGGIQGARFRNLRDLLGPFTTLQDVAARLCNETWQ